MAEVRYELTPHIRAVRAANARKAAAAANSPDGLIRRVEKVKGSLTDEQRARLLDLAGVLTEDGRIDEEALRRITPAPER